MLCTTKEKLISVCIYVHSRYYQHILDSGTIRFDNSSEKIELEWNVDLKNSYLCIRFFSVEFFCFKLQQQQQQQKKSTQQVKRCLPIQLNYYD